MMHMYIPRTSENPIVLYKVMQATDYIAEIGNRERRQ